MKVVHSNIRFLRLSRGLNQTQFGDLIGVHRTSVEAYEKGRNSPKPVTVAAICREFKITPDDLLQRDLDGGTADTARESVLLRAEVRKLKAEVAQLRAWLNDKDLIIALLKKKGNR